MDFKLINIIGVDGSGKTTLAKALVTGLQNIDPSIQYKYCQYFAKLLYPMKLAARLSVMRRTDEFKDYDEYNRTKKSTSSRFPFLANIYAGVWLLDYIIQIFFKVSLPLFLGKKFVVDRYIFDIAVNISLTTNNAVSYADKIIAFFLKFAPKPDIVIFIELPDEVAFARKNDIQDVAYLRERSERYRALARKYRFYSIDGTKTPEQMLIDTRRIIIGDAKR